MTLGLRAGVEVCWQPRRRSALPVSPIAASLLIGVLFSTTVYAQTPQDSSGPGRVAVTISVEGLRIPAVQVELHDVQRNVVVARTTADAIGQVMFSDVPAGRYIVRGAREGFADTDSTPFDVRGGVTEQVLIEMRLTFIRESVEVILPANSPTESLQPVAVSDLLTGAKMDVQPLAGDDFQSLLTTLPSARSRSRGTAAREGRCADDGSAAGEQRQPERPIDRRLRSRTAERRRGVGGSAVESFRSRVRPVLDQRHAGQDQARHRRVDRQAGQPDAELRQGLRRSVRAAAVHFRSAQARQAPVRSVPAVSPRAHTGQELARRADNRSR